MQYVQLKVVAGLAVCGAGGAEGIIAAGSDTVILLEVGLYCTTLQKRRLPLEPNGKGTA